MITSLSMFFPFYNDQGTVGRAIADAYFYGKKITNNLEVIAIHGGNSTDNTWKEILKQKIKYKDLVVVNKRNNWEGYAVIKYGFLTAKKEWIFYTDGDLQYHLNDLSKLVIKQNQTQADLVNGYRIKRHDGFFRVIFGNLYQKIGQKIFHLPIRDLTCDFRLIKRSFIKKINLEAHDASILLELIKKLQLAGAKFAQVPVKHYPRNYGKSNFNILKLIRERVIGDMITVRKINNL